VVSAPAPSSHDPRGLSPEDLRIDDATVADFVARHGAPTFAPVTVVIPSYGEAANIDSVLAEIPRDMLGMGTSAVVVVDGRHPSEEEGATARRVEAAGHHVAVAPVNRGQGAALRLGYHLAVDRGADYIVTTDADGQYEIGELPLLLQPLLAGTADFVTGSRRLGANESADRVRRLGTRVFARLVSVLTRQRITDTSFGFRAMRAEVPVSVTLHQPQYQSSELLVGVLSHGYRVVERPMTMHRRNQGRSKKGNNLVYGWRYARVVFGTWWRERKTTRSSSRNLATNSSAYVPK
jgi:glycosyltransferase involved in cell wall biosynthesis